MNATKPFTISNKPQIAEASLVVGWTDNAAGLGSETIEYLNSKLHCSEFAEIDPERFFHLNGVPVENDIAQFPESKFYCCPEKNLVLLKSSAPQIEWFAFLNAILDLVETVCPVKEVYTIGGMVSLSAHTFPRPVVANANSASMKSMLSRVGLNGAMDYETPPGQRPTLSSYLMWVAKRRSVSGACIWIPVPFYLAAVKDSRAMKVAIDFLNKKLDLGLDFADLAVEAEEQNMKISGVLQQYPELADLIRRLENNLPVTEEESNMLAEIMENNLRSKHRY